MSLISGITSAVMSSNATTSAAETSAAATTTAADTASQELYDTFTAEEALNQDYLDTSRPALAKLQSAILGGSASYQNAGYSFDMKSGMWKGPDGKLTSTPARTTTTYTPTSTPKYKYEQDALKSSLQAQGRNKSSYAGYLSGQLAANDYQTQISNLSGLAGVGKDSTSSLTSAASGTGTSLANIATSTGSSNSLSALLTGQAKSSLYSGVSSAATSSASTALKAYDLYKTYAEDVVE